MIKDVLNRSTTAASAESLVVDPDYPHKLDTEAYGKWTVPSFISKRFPHRAVWRELEHHQLSIHNLLADNPLTNEKSTELAELCGCGLTYALDKMTVYIGGQSKDHVTKLLKKLNTLLKYKVSTQTSIPDNIFC